MIVLSFFLITSCAENNHEQRVEEEKRELLESGIDIYDFGYFAMAPEAVEKQPLDKVIKLYFSEWSIDMLHEPIAIDIENSEMYSKPSMGSRGLNNFPDETIPITDAHEIIDILKKYDVQSWERDYTFKDPQDDEDGYSWSLILQFADGSLEEHGGAGTDIAQLTPENFREFVDELEAWVEDKTK